MGWRYRSGNERKRTGLKKATAAWALEEARRRVVWERQARVERASVADVAAETKAAAEAATGLPMHNGYPYEIRKQTGFESLTAVRSFTGALRITAKLETRSYTPAQLVELKALLDRFQQEG